ncbi:hypothetical protein SBRCBS47491_003550 [Sporothrix bragantina]|uniref:USP domain-containing protein n=1 Tax=Sporothrix bragantina TaxID=671064 RepID=A0ABP0BG52_9PEZI
MERESRSPEIDPSERAGSPELAGTRPNPFNDGGESLRKRRRTSLNVDSRSRSGESDTKSPGDNSGGEPTAPSSPSTVNELDDSAMAMDDGPTSSAPHTPENNPTTVTANNPPAVPAGGAPSHVTLSLRNSARHTHGTITSSSPPSPTPSGRLQDRDVNSRSIQFVDDSGTANGVPIEIDLTGTPTDVVPGTSEKLDTLPAGHSGTSSPPIEVVDIVSDDEDDSLASAEPQVTILSNDLGMVENMVLPDPSGEFPYINNGEQPSEIMMLLMGPLTQDSSVPQQLQEWIEQYLAFATTSTFDRVYESYTIYRPLWLSLPELVWSPPNLRLPGFGAPDSGTRLKVLSFCQSFARLAAFFVELDIQILERSSVADASQSRDTISAFYLIAISALTKRETSLRDEDRLDVAFAPDDISSILEQFTSFPQAGQGGTLGLLSRLLELQIAIMPTYPKISENFSPLCGVASYVTREAYRRIARANHSQGAIDLEKETLALGRKIFNDCSAALDTAISNHITTLTQENVSQTISALGDLVYIRLRVGEDEAAALASTIEESYPMPLDCIPDAFSMKWRFALFCRLIKNSQMQLRLMAMTNLCQELVGCWRRYGDQAQEHLQEESILRYAADVLMDAGLVSYMLGPTCHPEIIAESSNVIGFLAVTRTYTGAHTDLFWQTVTTTQDPRIAEALIRTASRIVNLFSYDAAVYLCKGFLDVNIGAFTSSMREFCEAVLRHVCIKAPLESASMDSVVPFDVCLHLLRESSIPGARTPVAYPDVQSFAIEKLGECLRSVRIDLDQRKSLYQTCLLDLTQLSKTTLGSLCAIHIINRHHSGRDLAFLTADNNLTRLVTDELEHAIREARGGPFPAVINGTANAPRRDILFSILLNHPDTLTTELSSRLWQMMAGPAANCKEDRNASWNIFNLCIKHGRQQENNPFMTQCLNDFLPCLPPSCFCELLLDFLRDRLRPLLEDVSCGLFEAASGTGQEAKLVSTEVRGIDRIALEQLWRIVLTAPPNTIERPATHFLVSGVYLESRCIQASPLQRTRKIHLALVSRCLQQLSSAASKLRTTPTVSVTIPNSADSKKTDGVVTNTALPEAVLIEQELLFIRSLKVLQEFLRLYRASSHFSVPNIRPYIPDSPKSVQGESAELKYQSFDGDKQTEVKPLNIGRRNTAASLLASLKEVTGFENYRIFYRGKAFAPNGVDICRSLEDLHIHNGLILVKRDTHPDLEDEEGFIGDSPVEYEITRHFKELWDYLSMDEKLSREIHEFLAQLPINEEFLGQFDQTDMAYTDVFYIGQTYKSLYALHALQQYLDLRRQPAREPESEAGAVTSVLGSSSGNSETADTQMRTPDSSDIAMPVPDVPLDKPNDQALENLSQLKTLPKTREAKTYSDALATAIRLVTSAICDTNITQASGNLALQIQLNTQLLKMLGFVLSSPELPALSCKYLDKNLLNRLMEILSAEFQCSPSESIPLLRDAFTAAMHACTLSRDFWVAFRTHEKSKDVIGFLLFQNEHLEIRSLAESYIGEKIGFKDVPSVVAVSEFREFFWPIVLGTVPGAINEPAKCEGVFNLADTLFRELFEANSPVLDIATLLRQVGGLLSSCTTSEDITQPECADYAMFGLTRLFQSIYRASQNLDLVDVLPANFMNKLFWKHLFPPWRNNAAANAMGSAVVAHASYPRIVVNSQTRALLMRVIFDLVDDDMRLLPVAIRNLDQLVPCEKGEDEELYHYDLPSIFERTRALRAPCGYVGLVNLSNTCYFNSLFTQLFMNVPFRQFMMNVEIRDETNTQSLLFQTRLLFGFLQDSIRRFVDTQSCVNSIKTYDDTLIDIHNQMDVDEFYNLLFDRWEGQLLSENDKKAFRSFFGGHIVQQVRSKECEHVSERLEPFSAIQCDIKGKASLQESLEAYVEGEVMEGDNKYKCSSCDRHVDAIKRACLKDIPDNLIFHLKRFDFNLRTLQRSKINDYFSFPHEIDMRPYTIDQLSNPSEEQTPDIFELVGVLIHSGTAESGHYYSYIRERPSSKTDESWFEFNDDTVSPWDHSLLESMCFGGSDSRSLNQYGNEGTNYGLSSDKSYSAYMLFYQRSSSLAQEQHALASSGITSPAKATLPTALFDHIHSENTSMVRRHALYDPQHIPFVSKMLSLVQFARPSGECSTSHKLEDLAIQMALSHLDQVAARTKDIPDFPTLLSGVAAMGQKCAFCSLAIFDYFDGRPEILRQMVQRSVDPSVRADMGQLLIASLTIIKEAFPRSYRTVDDESDMEADEEEDDAEAVTQNGSTELIRTSSILHGAAYMMQTLWEHFHAVTRSWPEVFSFMDGFVNMGREELGIFLDLEGFRRAILTISADPSFTHDAQFSRLLIVLQRRNRPPSYESLISLICSLLIGMYPLRTISRSEHEMFVDNNVSRLVLAQQDPDGDIPMSRYEYSIMGRDWNRDFGNVFVDKLISLDQNQLATNAIIVRLMATHPAMENKVFTTLKANITFIAEAGPQHPFLCAAQVFIHNATSAELAAQMMAHVAQQCRGLANGEGRSYFETLRGLYYGNTGTSGQADWPAVRDGLLYLPAWVPGLLCYFDTPVSLSVESFLQDEIFSHGPDPQFTEDEGGLDRAEMLKLTAKRLGVEMLKFIQLAFINREITISYSIAAATQRLVLACTPYYAPPDEETDDELSLDFRRLSAIIPDLLSQLAVDDIEEDGSGFDDPDWNSSRGSSEAGDSLGDTSMQTAGETNDVDMP